MKPYFYTEKKHAMNQPVKRGWWVSPRLLDSIPIFGRIELFVSEDAAFNRMMIKKWLESHPENNVCNKCKE